MKKPLLPRLLYIIKLAIGHPPKLENGACVLNEAQLLRVLLGMPEVKAAFEASGANIDRVRTALERCPDDAKGTVRSVIKILHLSQQMSSLSGKPGVPAPKIRFVTQVRYGNPLLVQLMQSAGVDLGAVIFHLAHGKAEASIGEAPAKAGVEIVNDDFTPMEFVIEMLTRHLGYEREKAVKAMLHVHLSSTLVIAQQSAEQARAVADAINREARAKYFPLRCNVVLTNLA